MNCTSLKVDRRCEGAGKLCLPQGICICDPGYMVLDAFSANTLNRCDIHEDTIKGLGIIEVTLASIYIIIIVRHLLKRLIAAKTFKLFLVDHKTFCAFVFLLIGVSDIIVALSYLTHKQKRIFRIDALISVSTALFTFLCFVGLSLYFQILLKFLRDSSLLMNSSNRNKVISRLTVMQRFSWLVVIFSIPISLSSILHIFNEDNAAAFAATVIIGIGVLLFAYVILYLVAFRFIIVELSFHLENSFNADITGGSHDLKLVLRRLKFAFYTGGASLLGASAAMVLFGSWDTLFYKFAYLGIFVRFIGIIIFSLLHMTISKVPVPPIERLSTKKISTIRKFFSRQRNSRSFDRKLVPIASDLSEKR